MKVLGVVIHAKGIRFSLLEGTIENPKLNEKKYIVVKVEEDVALLMDWFETTFVNEIERMQPQKVVCKLNLGPDKNQSITQIMPMGVLALCCKKKNIPLLLFTNRQFTPSKLRLEKNADLFLACDNFFGINKPHWDKFQKESIIGAWMYL